MSTEDLINFYLEQPNEELFNAYANAVVRFKELRGGADSQIQEIVFYGESLSQALINDRGVNPSDLEKWLDEFFARRFTVEN